MKLLSLCHSWSHVCYFKFLNSFVMQLKLTPFPLPHCSCLSRNKIYRKDRCSLQMECISLQSPSDNKLLRSYHLVVIWWSFSHWVWAWYSVNYTLCSSSLTFVVRLVDDSRSAWSEAVFQSSFCLLFSGGSLATLGSFVFLSLKNVYSISFPIC